MFKIEGTTIFLTRSDYAEATVTLWQGDTQYTPTGSDTVTFALKHKTMTVGGKRYVDETPLIMRSIPISTMLLQLYPGDTKDLDFGEYVYDIELVHDGKPDTFINNAKMIILPEVLDYVPEG